MPRNRPTRAAKKVKLDTAATDTDVDDALQSGDTFDQVFGGYPDMADETSDASDDSYYGTKRRPAVLKRARKQAKPRSRKLTLNKPPVTEAPAPDPMSDIEYDSEIGDEVQWLKPRPRTPPGPSREGRIPDASATPANAVAVAKRSPSTPNILKIHVNMGTKSGGSTINVDLTPLLNASDSGRASTISPDQDMTLPDDNTTIALSSSAATPSLRMQRLNEARARLLKADSPKERKTGFTDLPSEIRIRIYRSVFVTEFQINFHSRKNFQRSSSLLSTCKIVHEEGRAVLYGENAFHFERSYGSRGRFFDEDWREIGFKDIRRFLETIGTTNISMMRYISFEFADTNKAHTPVEEAERRCVNDPVVWHCLELIGNNARLEKFVFQFSGRKNLDRNDLHFLRALTTIKAKEVTNIANYSGGFKIKLELFADLKKLMVLPRDDADKVDETKKKPPTVVMHHERNRGTRFYELCCR